MTGRGASGRQALRGAELVPRLERQGQLQGVDGVAAGAGQLLGEDPLDLGPHPAASPSQRVLDRRPTRGRCAARLGARARSTRRAAR